MKLRVASLLGALLLSAGPALGKEPAHPMRIVSLNMCVDSILIALVSHDRIAALSHYARDPQRFVGRSDGEWNRSPHAFELPRRKVVFGPEILDFTGDAASERFRIKKSDGIEAAPSAAGGIPKLLDSNPVGTHRAQPGYDHSTAARPPIVSTHLDSSRHEMFHFLT